MDNGGFPYGDIIVIGVIAAFILLRYRAMLGESRGRDETARPIKTVHPRADLERVLQLPSTRLTTTCSRKKDDFASHGALGRNLHRICAPSTANFHPR